MFIDTTSHGGAEMRAAEKDCRGTKSSEGSSCEEDKIIEALVNNRDNSSQLRRRSPNTSPQPTESSPLLVRSTYYSTGSSVVGTTTHLADRRSLSSGSSVLTRIAMDHEGVSKNPSNNWTINNSLDDTVIPTTANGSRSEEADARDALSRQQPSFQQLEHAEEPVDISTRSTGPLQTHNDDEHATSVDEEPSTTLPQQHQLQSITAPQHSSAGPSIPANVPQHYNASYTGSPQRTDSHRSIPSLHPGRTYDSSMMNSHSYDQYTIQSGRSTSHATRVSSSSQSFAQTRRGQTNPTARQRSLSPRDHRVVSSYAQNNNSSRQRGSQHPSATQQSQYVPPSAVPPQRSLSYGSSTRPSGVALAQSGSTIRSGTSSSMSRAAAAAAANYQYQQALSDRQLYYNNRATRMLHRGMYNEYHNPEDRYPASSSPILEVPEEIYAVRRAALTVLRPLTRAWVSCIVAFLFVKTVFTFNHLTSFLFSARLHCGFQHFPHIRHVTLDVYFE